MQFISYEGTFTATGGPADGMTSADIGVAETAAQPWATRCNWRGQAAPTPISRGPAPWLPRQTTSTPGSNSPAAATRR
ncbi:MAG: hypothetical protein R2856_32155 [Caldilineaceae bacterium]